MEPGARTIRSCHPARGHRGPRWLGAVVVAMTLLTGCPTRFDPRAAPARSSPDPAAEAAFRAARERYEAGALDEARSKLGAFVAAYPNDPLRPVAETLLGRIAYGKRDFARARDVLRGPAAASDAAVADPARYLLGLTVYRLGQPAEARRLLEPFAGRVSGDDAAELYGTLAEAAARLGDVPAALAAYGSFYQVAKDHERAYIRERAEALAAGAPAASVAQLYAAAPRGSLAAAVLGQRLAAITLDPRQRAAVVADIRGPRAAFGLVDAGAGDAAQGGEDARVIGAVLPLSGTARAVGEAALKGVLLGANAPSAAGQPRLEVAVRDSGGDPTRSARAVEELAREGAIAIVGPIERRDTAAAGRAAEAQGVPLIALDVAEGAPAQAGVFHALPGPGARAAALAQHAASAGVRDVAVIAPDNGYGHKVAAAFVAAAGRAGLKVVAEERYAPQATTFAKVVARLKGRRFGAVFVPDRAATLELLAPALARAGLWPRGPQAGERGRGILLLATAEGLSPKLLQAAGRYVQGAVLAPGFYADLDDERLATFANAFRDSYGGEPGMFEAFGHDAVRIVRAAIAAGATSRGDLRVRLARGVGFPGATGEAAFAPDGERADPPLLYAVDGERIRVLRAARPRRGAR
jgi:ABC-type branched-subunit amino acid transport system substrate-binding protein